MQFQLAEIDFVERVGSGVIVDEVVGNFLVSDEGWNAFEQEIEIVGAERSVIRCLLYTSDAADE